ncbi:MAG: glycosyltransferase family 4 protein [Gammaproteobacteria bacterium]|nr:glycosyltransferase family 4 protein [Gammaproteobacteria bacterium]
MRVLAVTAHSDLPETQMFIGLKRAGVEFEVMCPDDAPHRQKLIDSGVEVHSLELKGRLDSDGASRIRQRLVGGQFDILHTFNNKAVSNGLRASKGLDVSFIAYRGIEANVSVFDPASWTTYLHPRVDKIICVADAIRQYLVNMKFLWWRFPADKAITIYKGHDLGWYQAPAVPRSEFGIPQDAFVVGCTANERPRKGLPYLVEAAKLLPHDADIHFLLIGNIGGAKTLQRIAESPARDRFHLTGFRRDAPQVLASCNACILPAIKREGLPKGIIEGMVHAVTPIVTDSGGSPELIEHGKSGLIIPPQSSQAIADAILRLYEDRSVCRQMGVEAQRRIQRDFHVSKTIEQTLSLYRELCSK